MPTFTCSVCCETESDCNCLDCGSCGETFAYGSSRFPCSSCERCTTCVCSCCDICDGTDSDNCRCCTTCRNTDGNCNCCANCNTDLDDCVCEIEDDEDEDRPARPPQPRHTPVSPLPSWAVAPPPPVVIADENPSWVGVDVAAPEVPPAPPEPTTKKCTSCFIYRPLDEMCTKEDINCVRYGNCVHCCFHAKCQHGYQGKCWNCKNCLTCCLCPKCPTCSDSSRARCEVCDNCLTCCTCARCNRYAYYADHPTHIVTEPETVCVNCTMCTSSCKCPKCSVCDSRSELCGYCHDCETCCGAGECGAALRNRSHFEYKKRDFKFFDAESISLRKTNPSKRHISVELETYSYSQKSKGKKLHEAVEKWSDSVVEDGSIGSGREINTNPSAGDVFLEHMRDVCDGLEAIGATVNDKCGMHVHINAKDISTYELRRVIILYEKIERALFDTCHPIRLNNQYSQKCGHFFTKNLLAVDPSAFKAEIYGALYNDGKKITKPSRRYLSAPSYYSEKQKEVYLKQQRHTQLLNAGNHIKGQIANKSHSLRYRALNLHSYFLRGSIEFRHHEGSTDYRTITGFGRVCAEIISKASSLTEKQITALPRNSRRALMAILPKDLQEFVAVEWTRNDAIRNNPCYSYKQNYTHIWGL